MQITDPNLVAYLRHRAGEQPISSYGGGRVRTRALELNAEKDAFLKTFGRKEIAAYVGFVDLAGFSDAVSGKSPQQIVDYLEPILNRLVSVIRARQALIDKTIGDEVMFVLPEIEEASRGERLLLGQLMGGLHDLAFELRGRYPFRIGLSYGDIQFFKVRGSGYSEWTAVGETIHVAKRLHSLQALEKPQPVVGAFGMQVGSRSVEQIRAAMNPHLGIFAGVASRFDHRFVDEPASLKGVGKVLYALLTARSERATAPMAD